MTNIVGNPINLISTGPQAATKGNHAAPVTTIKIDAKPELASSGLNPEVQTGAIQRTTIDQPETSTSNDLPSAEYTVVHRSFAPWKKFGHVPGMTSETDLLPKIMETDESFYGDNRGFSLNDGTTRWDVKKVTARIHQVAKIRLDRDEKDKYFAPAWSSETRGKKNFIGKEEIAFCQPVYQASFIKNNLLLQFAGTDPLVIVAPAIDWKAKFNLSKRNLNGVTYLHIKGQIEGKGFPAYECFIVDRNNNKVFIHTYACPKKLDLAIELRSPLYDYKSEFNFMIEINENGLFKREVIINAKKSDIDSWNETNWTKSPAPDCRKSECGNY